MAGNHNADRIGTVCRADRTGRACHSAYLTFTAEGDPEGISNDNSAGNLEDNPQ